MTANSGTSSLKALLRSSSKATSRSSSMPATPPTTRQGAPTSTRTVVKRRLARCTSDRLGTEPDVVGQAPLGRTGITGSRLILGCGGFGGIGSDHDLIGKGESDDEAAAIMDAAWELGIT